APLRLVRMNGSALYTIYLSWFDIRAQPHVARDQLIRDRHQLPEHLIRRLREPDVVIEGLRHLPDPVGAFQERHRHHQLWLLTVGSLDLAAHQKVEQLVPPPQLHVGPNRYRVHRLEQRVEELHDAYGRTRVVPGSEVIPIQHLSDRRRG